jgi:hypothetical protein
MNHGSRSGPVGCSNDRKGVSDSEFRLSMMVREWTQDSTCWSADTAAFSVDVVSTRRPTGTNNLHAESPPTMSEDQPIVVVILLLARKMSESIHTVVETIMLNSGLYQFRFDSTNHIIFARRTV